MTDVYLTGRFVGTITNPVEFLTRIVEERRKGVISSNVNVHYDEELDELHVENGKGRLRRPLIVVRDGRPMFSEGVMKKVEEGQVSWEELVNTGVVEYLDAAEEESTLVAFSEEYLTPEHTHLEMAPFDMFGLCTSLVPYSNFSAAQKVNTGSKNQKQALGFYAANFMVRMDMDVSLIYTPQRPIVRTIMHKLSNYDKHPSGQNIVVAVMSYRGYNMDDATVLNKGSIDFGFGRSSYYRPAIAEELRYSGGLIDEICIPDKEVKGYKSEHDYRFLEGDGIIFPEAKVAEGDVVIGKTSPPRFLSSMEQYNLAAESRRESSVAMRHGESGIIDLVIITENGEGNKLIQVKVRDQRCPEIGDKFTSRHGQKGVVGLIVPKADMPFTASGIVPDLIFSPHSVPTRMTIAHLIELIGGKVGALAGRYIDGTAFDAEPEEAVRQELLALGFRDNGVETMYNGVSGEQFKVGIFIGNMYYLKLKHMVANKLHSRARGPVQLLTRQPTEGRAKEGGLRLGEMEKDTFVAHGAALLLKERFDSDKTRIPVCEECGLVAVYDEFKKRAYCPICGDNAEINFIEIPYAFKLILDEFKSMCIYPKLVLKNKY
ncbi:DNA-directed RNA polymerase subunit B [Candidatus Woesearchaeota archaeon CG08_land_8_20_14_0_20_47_9]|nr:MAG: DNA-directed RNA polymerase subunit B [Candidatus Woesearchaeota archaeon CG1_02_47_18]PIO04412.1 MAG: DNA-directed RNA polymerase subunit B [Candidatus Woesearchaeota archaeon CG08_land_8_20_14_0_20_47_9]HII29651.1 DNA-directed RNA polymerase subunit B [Candidatus Woesearchaeota archaeon]